MKDKFRRKKSKDDLPLQSKMCIYTEALKKRIIITLETPDKHYLSQVIKVNSHRDYSCWLYNFWCDAMTTALSRCGLPAKTQNPSVIMRKTSDTSQWRWLGQCNGPALLKTAQVIKNRESLSTCHSPAEPRRHGECLLIPGERAWGIEESSQLFLHKKDLFPKVYIKKEKKMV